MGVKFTANMEVRDGVINRAKEMLRGAAEKIAQHRVTVGIHEDEGGEAKVDYDGSDSASSLALVAMWHEFGTGTIPDRSFLRQWHDTNLPRLKQAMKVAMQEEYGGNKSAVHELADRWADEVRRLIESGATFAALRQRTIARKSAAGLSDANKPLIATRQLINAIRARVDGADA